MLYHKDIYIPENIKEQLPDKPIKLVYSRHAEDARHNDRYGEVTKLSWLNPAEAEVIEVEVIGGKIIKVVYRLKMDDTLDQCVVVNVPEGLVRTVWANRRNDNHKTLNKSKYERAQ